MAEYRDREHFIPLRKSDLIELLYKDKRLPAEEREPFRQFCKLVGSVFHFEYLRQLEDLKDAYAAFDPDADTRPLCPPSAEELRPQMEKLFEKFLALMERANFKRLDRTEVEAAIEMVASDWGLDMDVDLSVFERLEVFARGDVVGTRTRRRWWKLWRREEVRLPLYQRLVLILKLRPHRRLDKDVSTEKVYLKIFKDFPKMDMEMLLPGARVRLSRLDRALILYPLLFGVGLTLFNVLTDLTGSIDRVLHSLARWSIAVAIGGYGYKSYYSYQVKKQDYSLRLNKSLYYQTLDSNTGVLMRLLDEAEEQECRETFLAYFCLWKYAPDAGWSPGQLDDFVELYLEGNARLKVDFEIGDALAKLERLGLVVKSGDVYKAQPLDRALEVLDWTWDNYFQYNTKSPELTQG